MIERAQARKILEYYGYTQANIEPFLYCENGVAGLFVTLKTKYGHLSRLLKFESEDKLKKFLKIYTWYRKNLKSEFVTVSFSDYINLSPEVKFFYKDHELNEINVMDVESLDKPVEELVIDTTVDENIELSNVVIDLIQSFFDEIKDAQQELKNVFQEFMNKLDEYGNYFSVDKDKKLVSNSTIFDNYNNAIKINIEQNTNSFEKDFNDLIDVYKKVQLDTNYIDNLFLISFYNEEIRYMNDILNEYKIYNNLKESDFKKKYKKKNVPFDVYLSDKNIAKNQTNKEIIKSDKEILADKNIEQFKNKSISHLKSIFNIVKEPIKEEKVITKELTHDEKYMDIASEFNNNSIEQRNMILAINSPIKSLINILYTIDKNKIGVEYVKSNYFDDFNDLYIILSNQDNYAKTRKYLKFIKLDFFDEFIQSIINMFNNFEFISTRLNYELDINFKLGTIKNAYIINASVENEYPINNKGKNNYCHSKLKANSSFIYSPYIIKIDDDNCIYAEKNMSIININLNNYKVSIINKILVNNYSMKKDINSSEGKIQFPLFSEKQYCEVELNVNI